MFSRLTAVAALFAIVTTASLVCATSLYQRHASAAKVSNQVVMLERVVVTGKRVADPAH